MKLRLISIGTIISVLSIVFIAARGVSLVMGVLLGVGLVLLALGLLMNNK